MKRIVLMMSVAVLAMMFNSCVTDVVSQPDVNKKSTHKLTISASSDVDSKVAVEALPDNAGYKVNWQEGDFIVLSECVPALAEYYWDSVRDYYSTELEDSDIVDNKASFTFELEDRTGENVEYTYLAYYGQNVYSYYEFWENADDEMYLQWAQMFEHAGEYVEPHMLVSVQTPMYQSPSENSFDPMADVVISRPVVTDQQLAGEAIFNFGRMGAIVKITLKGLEEYCGQEILDGSILWGDSYQVHETVVYDPILNKYAHREDIEECRLIDGIRFTPNGVVVREDGTVDIWLKMPSGEIDDWFKIELTVGDVMLSRTVDLASLAKTLTFEDGQMTVFSVSDFLLAIVDGVYNIDYTINEAKDGFKATWDAVEYASGYHCFLTDSYNMLDMELEAFQNADDTWSVEVTGGLPADLYTLHVKPIPDEGYALMYDYYDECILYVGVPETWHFHHAAFSEDSEALEGTDDSIITGYIPVPVRFKNLYGAFDSSWHTLKSNGDWYFYNTESLNEIHSIEVWSKNDSHTQFSVYAAVEAGGESVLLDGEVVEVNEINAGSGSYKYVATHKLVRYTFPTDQKYGYFKFEGEAVGVILTSQTSYVKYFK